MAFLNIGLEPIELGVLCYNKLMFIITEVYSLFIKQNC